MHWGVFGTLLLIYSSAFAGKEHYPMRFDHLTQDDGLSQSAVVTILQDSQGFMWFGTENGLNRYDGYAFEHFKRERGNPGALQNDFIYDLVEDRRGGLWIATNGGGLAFLDGKTGAFRSFRHDAANPGSIASNVVRSIAGADGAIWLGLRNSGLDRFDPETETFTHYALAAAAGNADEDISIFDLHQDSQGVLWVGSDQGLYSLNTESGQVERYRHNPADPSSISQDRVRKVYEDRQGTLWVGTHGGGLNRLDREAGTFDRFQHDAANAGSISNDRVTAILEDTDLRLWVGTAKGLNLVDRASDTFVRYQNKPNDTSSLGGDAISSLYQDRSGLLWVGTLTGGLSKWNPLTWGLGLQDSSVLTDAADTQPNVTSFATNGSDTVWIGTFGEGLTALNRSSGQSVHYRHDPADPNSISGNRVMALLMDSRGKLWVGTMTAGLNLLDPTSGLNTVFEHKPDDPRSLGANGVMSIFEDGDGLIWVGTFGGGIGLFDPNTASFTRYTADPETPGSLSSPRITSFAEDHNGRLWIGTDAGGLNLFDRESQTFHAYRSDPDDPQSLADDTVYSLHVDAEGTVWAGTRGGGLDRVLGSSLRPDSIKFVNLSQTDGLSNDVIYGIQSDDAGELWLSTNYGISRVNANTGSIRNMHRADGLQSDEFNFGAHHRSSSGELFFGGLNGFNAFKPRDLQVNKTVPPVLLTGFFLSNDPIKSDLPTDLDDGIDISHRDDSVSFEFAALDFASPKNNRYMYKLEGFDRDWIDLQNRRRVTYTDLDDGNYLLRVKAANSDGTWNEAGFSLPIRVSPAPWDTWWAYVGYFAMAAQLALFLWLGHRRKMRREEEYSRRLEMEVRDRTTQLSQRNEELNQLNKSLQESSLSDPLTGLRNRRFVFEEVSRDLATISRKYSSRTQGLKTDDASDLVFMMIDLDNFKPINDTYGHAAGDKMLLDIRDVLLSTCRRSDFVIRWGGDEFVVIAKQAHAGESEALAERIRHEIESRDFTLPDGQFVRTTCSIGFVAFPLFRGQADQANLDEVINVADNLMYEAKRQRNAWVGMLSINDAVTSKGFDPDSIETSSLLFRARRSGRLIAHDPDTGSTARRTSRRSA